MLEPASIPTWQYRMDLASDPTKAAGSCGDAVDFDYTWLDGGRLCVKELVSSRQKSRGNVIVHRYSVGMVVLG